jgi:hypothetical protein
LRPALPRSPSLSFSRHFLLLFRLFCVSLTVSQARWVSRESANSTNSESTNSPRANLVLTPLYAISRLPTCRETRFGLPLVSSRYRIRRCAGLAILHYGEQSQSGKVRWLQASHIRQLSWSNLRPNAPCCLLLAGVSLSVVAVGGRCGSGLKDGKETTLACADSPP